MRSVGELRSMVGQIPPAPNVGHIGWFDLVQEWCNGGNDKFGTCAFAAIGNLHCVVTATNGAPEVFSDGEIEKMYHDVAGFSPTDASTDHGAQLLDVLKYWCENGWAGDPTLKPLGYCVVDNKDDIPETIHQFAGVYAWCLLPMFDFGSGDEPDLSDVSLGWNVEGTVPHAVFIAGAQGPWLWIVTWGRLVLITKKWWERYGRDCYGVLHPAWTHPQAVVEGTNETEPTE